MTFEEIRKDIKARKYKPIYFLCGEEPFFIDRLTALLENTVLTEDEKAFNQTVLYGNDVSMSTITDTARRIYFESAKLYDNKIPEWIIGYCKEKSYGITTKAAGILAESLGTDLSRVANEIDKLVLLLPQGGEIQESLVEEHTGISKDFNSFELLSAIIRKDFLKANQIVNYFEANPKNNPLVLTITTLFRYFLNLLTYHYQKKTTPNTQEMARLLGVHPFFMKDYIDGGKIYNAMKCATTISLLREYDMKSKGVGNANISDGELLKELIFKIMH